MYSVVIPVFNEEAVLPEFVKRLSVVMENLHSPYECIFVDDGSVDQSLEILEKFRQKNLAVKILSFSRNFGHQAALSAGLDVAQGEAVIIIDADLQDPPELIPQLIAQWQNDFQVVYAERTARRGESVLKRVTAHLFYIVLRRLAKYPIPENVGDFRLLDKRVVYELRKLHEHHRFLRGLISWVGFRQTSVKFVRDSRYAGVTKYPFKKMLVFALDGITSFSIVPLRWASGVGCMIVLLSIVLALYALWERLIFHVTIQGWTSLLLTIIFMGGVQLLMLGVVSEYIGRMYEELKDRPLYVVKKHDGFDDNV